MSIVQSRSIFVFSNFKFFYMWKNCTEIPGPAADLSFPLSISIFIYTASRPRVFYDCLLLKKALFLRLAQYNKHWWTAFSVYFFGGLECVGHSFAYVAHLWFLRDVWIRTQSTAVASWRATDLATHASLFERDWWTAAIGQKRAGVSLRCSVFWKRSREPNLSWAA